MSRRPPETFDELVKSIELSIYDAPSVVRTIYTNVDLSEFSTVIRGLWKVALDTSAFGLSIDRAPNSHMELPNRQTDYYYAHSHILSPSLHSIIESVARRTR